jgi:hypothetical protein
MSGSVWRRRWPLLLASAAAAALLFLLLGRRGRHLPLSAQPSIVDLTKVPGTVFRVALAPDLVRIAPEVVAGSLVAVNRDGNDLLFEHPTGALPEARAGSLVLFSGLGLRKVLSTRHSHDLLLIHTVPAGLQEAVRDGVMQWEYPVRFGDLARALARAHRAHRSASLLAFTSPAFAASADEPPIKIRHNGEKNGWQFETIATIRPERLDLEETLRRQDGDMEIKLQVKGYLANFRTYTNIEFHNGAITKFEYVNRDVQGRLEFGWATRKAEAGVGTLAPPSQVVKLPPFAELPLDIGGFPFTLDITSVVLAKPALTGGLESAHGHFTVDFAGDQGLSVSQGVTTPIGSIRADPQITEDIQSMSPVAPMGFVAAVAFPRLELRQGFVASSMQGENGALAERVKQLMQQNGMGDRFDPGVQSDVGGTDGSYVEIITSTGLVDSGRQVIFPCQQTSLFLSLKVGAAKDLGVSVATEGQSYELQQRHRINPPIQACAKGLVYGSVQQAPSTDMGKCDPNMVGSASDFAGVPGGGVMQPFKGEFGHKGIDVQKLRGSPVFANLRAEVPLTELNSVKVVRGQEYYPCGGTSAGGGPDDADCFKVERNFTGLGIAGTGNARLVDAVVLVQKWSPPKDPVGSGYGGLVGFAAHYQYTGTDGAIHTFTVYLEYEHLITADYPPRKDNGDYVDNENRKIKRGEYAGCMGFGAGMQNGRDMAAAELANHPLIGYLGATENPHVHIQAAFAPGATGYLRGPFFDPTVMLAGR